MLENQGTAGENYDSNASVTLQIDRPEYNSFEYRKIPIDLVGNILLLPKMEQRFVITEMA